MEDFDDKSRYGPQRVCHSLKLSKLHISNNNSVFRKKPWDIPPKNYYPKILKKHNKYQQNDRSS